MLTFISGGVRSGKSSFAEQRAMTRAKDKLSLHYIATSGSMDEEMKARIHYHQQTRKESSVNWMNWEREVNLDSFAGHFTDQDIVLVDCLTTWLSNELFAGWQTGEMKWESKSFRKRIYEKIIKAIEDLHKEAAEMILVSNELFSEPLPNERSAICYLELLGKLHQEVAAKADAVFLVENGIARAMKMEEKTQ